MHRERRAGNLRYVQFVLTQDGVGAVGLGMSREEARAVVSSWGKVEPFSRGTKLQPGELADWFVLRDGMAVFVYCDTDGFVNAIEVSSPGHGVVASDQVSFDGVDLFVDPADAVIDALRERGHIMEVGHRGYTSTAPEIYLTLWRDGDPINEMTGLPMYFESALIARPGYGV